MLHYFQSFPNKRQGRAIQWAARILVVLLLLAPLARARAAVSEIRSIGLTVGDLDRELAFYTGVLRFELVGRRATGRGAADDFFGLPRSETRSVELRLGEEHVTLTEHLTNKGLPIPADSRSNDHWFQHIAIVVRDMDAAYRHLREQGIRHVSTGPQTLPGWN
ncbi:MAG: VOC family protein, partial [Verrucomicrobiota bacterium]